MVWAGKRWQARNFQSVWAIWKPISRTRRLAVGGVLSVVIINHHQRWPAQRALLGAFKRVLGLTCETRHERKDERKEKKFPPLAHLSRPETNLSAPNDACSTGYTTLGWSCAMGRKYCYLLACVTGAKRGGRGGGRKAPPPIFPFSLSPIPFDACYAGYYLSIRETFTL